MSAVVQTMLCWCGKPATMVCSKGTGPCDRPLCPEHAPQYEIKLVRMAQFGPDEYGRHAENVPLEEAK